jgi:hypothetical protein
MARPDADGNITCTGCERTLPGTIEYFHRHRDGFKPKCKECRGGSFGVTDINKVREREPGHKFCAKCHRELPATVKYFHRSPKTESGFQSRCKECHGFEFGVHHPNQALDLSDNERYCNGCETEYPATEEYFYQIEGGERWESYCKACSTLRKNQLRRRLRNEVEEDLTPDEWESIKEIWRSDDGLRCAYCGDVTDTPERDHVTSLSEGGDTTAKNIVPACAACNRSKGTASLSEWYVGSKQFDDARWALIRQHLAGETAF